MRGFLLLFAFEPLLARAMILNNQGTTLWNMGRLEASIEAYAEALVIYRALALPRHAAHPEKLVAGGVKLGGGE